MAIPVRRYYLLLKEYLKPYKGLVALLGGLVLALSLLELIIPQVIGTFLQGTQTGVAAADLVRDGLFVISLVLIKIITSVSSSYVSQKLGWKATNDLRTHLVSHALELDMEFHNTHSPGEMIERIDGDVTQLDQFFSFFSLQVVCNFLIMAGILAYTFWARWWIGLILFGAALVAGVVIIWVSQLAIQPYKYWRECKAALSSFNSEYLGGRLVIRANNARSFLMRGLWKVMQDYGHAINGTFIYGELTSHVPYAVNNVLQVAILGVCAFLYLSGKMELGVVYILYSYSGMIVSRLGEMSDQVSWLQSASPNIDRIQMLLTMKSKLAEPSVQSSAAGTTGLHHAGATGIRFQNVSFAYETGPEPANAESAEAGSVKKKEKVLKEITFDLQPGQVLGLLGRTGSGKTTLTRLLFRLYDPDEGSISLFCGEDTPVDLRNLPLASLRTRIGLVTQEVQFFHASLRDNLTFFKNDVPDEQIIRVIADLGLGDWFKALPAGLESDLDTGGLSAGQAQLLACSRIFLYHPDIFILDEATSRLDPLTENLMKRTVERLTGTCTMIIVAHRLETIEKVNDILILENGRILEKGPRTTLIADPASIYNSLLHKGLADLLA